MGFEANTGFFLNNKQNTVIWVLQQLEIKQYTKITIKNINDLIKQQKLI
jgi:hypothetical protein